MAVDFDFMATGGSSTHLQIAGIWRRDRATSVNHNGATSVRGWLSRSRLNSSDKAQSNRDLEEKQKVPLAHELHFITHDDRPERSGYRDFTISVRHCKRLQFIAAYTIC